MAEAIPEEFRLIRLSERNIERYKMAERGYVYDRDRTIGDTTHWQCERRGLCKARLHTKGMNILKPTGEHLHDPDDQQINCLTLKA